MKAWELQKRSMYPQYARAIKEISLASELGQTSTLVCHNSLLYPEVAQLLAADGYDVKVVKRKNRVTSYNEVSWCDAERGRMGTVDFIDETK